MNLKTYFSQYQGLISSPEIFSLIEDLAARINRLGLEGRKIILAGNGASASMASHLATDFSKQCGVRALAFNDANLITALGNDCGYENWISRSLDFYADRGDILILISSSGRSPNVVNAAMRGKELGLYVVAFTGFDKDNPLGAATDINFWVNSHTYNVIECTHMIWLTAVVDLLDGSIN